MNKLGKAILGFFVSILFFSTGMIANAETIDVEEIEIEEVNELTDLDAVLSESYPLQISDSETVYFSSEEDREFYLDSTLDNNSGIAPMSAGVKTRVVGTTRQRRYNVFLGYNSLTPTWSYASSYTMSSGKRSTFTTGYTYDGFSASISVAYNFGVSVTIPANSSRSSRLGARGDVTLQKNKVEAYYGTTVVRTFYTMSIINPSNITNVVVYR